MPPLLVPPPPTKFGMATAQQRTASTSQRKLVAPPPSKFSPQQSLAGSFPVQTKVAQNGVPPALFGRFAAQMARITALGRGTVQCAQAIDDDAGYNWNIVIQYNRDLAERIEWRLLDGLGRPKMTRRNCVTFIRSCGYGDGKLAHGSGKRGSGVHPQTQKALTDIAKKFEERYG